jgi:hypothetical protein
MIVHIKEGVVEKKLKAPATIVKSMTSFLFQTLIFIENFQPYLLPLGLLLLNIKYSDLFFYTLTKYFKNTNKQVFQVIDPQSNENLQVGFKQGITRSDTRNC